MMSFADVVIECIDNKDLVKEFNRLNGCSIGQSTRRSPIELAIDKACGYSCVPREKEEDIILFIAFVYNCVWCRLPPEFFELRELRF